MSEPSDPSQQSHGESAPRTVLEAIVFTDIEDSVGMAGRLGLERYAVILKRHGALFHDALRGVKTGHLEKHTGDGYMARFGRPSDAVAVALRFQWLIAREAWGSDCAVRVRIGIHQGEILLISTEHEGPASVGTPQNLAARVMSMGAGGQVLLTRAVFDDARQFIRTIPDIPVDAQAELGWEAHGSYLIKGLDSPVEIFEVGERGRAPFHKPEDGPAARRSVSAEEEATLGWRPAKQMEVPKRNGWFLREKLGEGGFGEVWLAENRRTPELRVFKFCFDAMRLRTFKRELALFRLICERLGKRRDIATLYEAQLDTAPFFLESEYCPGGTLRQWLEAHPSPLPVRLGIVARVARALAAAHSAGIIHKDVKPSNIFMEVREDGTPQPRLADFGIGVVQDPAALAGLDLTFSVQADDAALSRTGTRLYNAPAYAAGEAPTFQGDIYSLGVLLYQVVIGNFERPLGEGWQRDVPDELLVEDIAACVHANPALRLESAEKLAERLETLEQRRAERERERRRVERARRTKRTFVVGTIAAVLIGLSGIVAVQVKRARATKQTHFSEMSAEQERAAEQRYVTDMQTAMDDLAKNRTSAAREVLDHYVPKPGERDRRGWEWHLADARLHTGHEMRTVSTQPLRALAVSADEAHVAVAGDAGEVTIWSCETLEKIATWSAGAHAVGVLGWNEAGTIATGLANGDMVLWEAGGRKLKSWHANEGAVTALVWHPQMNFLITGGADGSLTRWDDAGHAVWQLRKEAPVQALDWREDGSELAVIAGRPARLLVAEEASLAQQHEYDLATPESALAWRPGFYEVAIAMKGVPLSSWNPYSCATSFSLDGRPASRSSAYTWSAGGDRAAAGGIDGTITLVDPNRAGDSRIALSGHKGRVTALRWLHGKRERLLSIAEDGTLGAWDELRRSPEAETTVSFPTPIADAQWHPIENKLAVLLAGDELQIVGGDSLKTEWSRALPQPMGARTAFAGGRIAWSPDGQWIAAVCAGRAPVAWRVADGEKKMFAGMEGVSDLEWLADSKRLLLRTARGWSCDGAEIPGTENAAWLGGLADERLGAVFAENGTPHFHTTNMAGGEARLDTALPGDFGAVRRCVLNRDRTLLAVAGESGAVLWIDTRIGKWSRAAAGHTGPASALAWHCDCPRLASVGTDGACRIFNVTLGAQNWLLDHHLKPDVVAVGWSADGRRLMLASSEEKRVKIYDASSSYDRAKGVTTAPPRVEFSERLAQACAWIERHPCEEFGWQALAQIAGGERADESAQALLAAARLGVEARFCPIEEASAAPIAKTWKEVPLPAAVQVAEALALGKWDEALAASGDAGSAWFALARAEALARLGRRDDAEAANFDAWKSLRHDHGCDEKAPGSFSNSAASEGVDLSQWANVKRTEDWLGAQNNNLSSLRETSEQPGGWRFHPRDFIQLTGKSLRLSGGRMLPRSTGWIPLSPAANEAGFLVAACYVDVKEHLQDHCIGSLFLLRQGGRGVVRIPLIYGRNVWDWWTPSSGYIKDAPQEAVAWTGENPNATYHRSHLKLYRIQWEAGPGEAPVIALSIASHLRRPAPMLVAAEVVR